GRAAADGLGRRRGEVVRHGWLLEGDTVREPPSSPGAASLARGCCAKAHSTGAHLGREIMRRGGWGRTKKRMHLPPSMILFRRLDIKRSASARMLEWH